jgi:hypothetical protein
MSVSGLPRLRPDVVHNPGQSAITGRNQFRGGHIKMVMSLTGSANGKGIVASSG